MRTRTSGRSRLAWLLLLAAAGSARADTKLPGGATAPPPRSAAESAETRWPTVLPCARPTQILAVTEHRDDVLRWSSASGAQQLLDHLGDKPWRPLSTAFGSALPTRLAWVVRRPRRPKRPECPTEDSCVRELDLRARCEDGGGEVGWLCDDHSAILPVRCYASVTYAYENEAVRRRYQDVDGRIVPLLRDPPHARDVVVGWALQLIEDACGTRRCSERAAEMAAQLRAVRNQPAWTGSADEHSLHQYAASGKGELSCSHAADPAFGSSCELKVGSIDLSVIGSISGPRAFLSEESTHGFIGAGDNGLTLDELLMR